jgi:spoIIIJ-associated protein
MDYSEKWGRSVEEATELALKDLRLESNQVEIIILEEPSKGFFGIGSRLAKVRVQKIGNRETKTEPASVVRSIEPSSKPIETPIKREQSNRDRTDKNRSPITRDKMRKTTAIREKPENLQEIFESPALDFLVEVTSKMGLDLSVKALANEESLYFDISGKDSGTIIGKRGQTLDSIQYLTSLVANKDKTNYIRVVVDAENYREKRERTLEQLAHRLADKVQKTGKSVRLEPMNPYERKVIHSTLQQNSSVSTRSEGEEPYRRVIIEHK